MRRKWILIGVVILGAAVVLERHTIKPFVRAAVQLCVTKSWGELREPRVLVTDSLIAHACGGVAGRSYTNTLTALDSNYIKGHRVFELDLERTTDGKVVLIHDWQGSWVDFHPTARTEGRRSLSEFLTTPMSYGFRPLDWEKLAEWLVIHRDASIVTDVKDDNLAILKILAERKDLVPRIIPQIYNFRQFASVQKLGYPRILLTLYRIDIGSWAVVQFIKTHPVSGIVCRPDRGREGDLVKQLHAMGVPAIAHTINSVPEAAELKAEGFTGVMTDFLVP